MHAHPQTQTCTQKTQEENIPMSVLYKQGDTPDRPTWNAYAHL